MDVGVRGIEHVGITVPDVDEATEFLLAAFGAEVLYDMIDRPLGGPMLERALGLPPGTTIQRIRMIRLAQGPNLELFEYSVAGQRPAHRPCDVGVQHFCVYVDDIDAAVQRVRDAGAEVWGDPVPLPGADAGPGNRCLYARAPWGTAIELITYPSPQAYEATTGKRRWRPEGSAGLLPGATAGGEQS